MFARLVYESFRRQKRSKLLAGAAITLGVAVATAMIAVATDVGDKINRELRSFGANLVVNPAQDSLDVTIGGVDLKPPGDAAYLNESDLPKIKGMFWRNNIVGFAPMLPVSVKVGQRNVTIVGTYFSQALHFGAETFVTGVRATYPLWKVQGSWPADESQDVLIGERLAESLARRTGDQIVINDKTFRIAGILSTGAAEDNEILAPLSVAQGLLSKPGAVRQIFVSAITKPEDAFARRDPKTLSPEMYDRWYCSPYAQSIAFQLQEAIPHSRAEQIRQIAQTEGTVLTRIKGLMLLVTLAALFASALAVSAAMATTIFERRREIGLMKALGAGGLSVANLFLAESVLLALLAGSIGFAAGSVLANRAGRWIFDSPIRIQPVVFPLVLLIAVIVTFAGSAAAIRRAVKFDPVHALRGEA
jgi:putative ABC transport system permease protein